MAEQAMAGVQRSRLPNWPGRWVISGNSTSEIFVICSKLCSTKGWGGGGERVGKSPKEGGMFWVSDYNTSIYTRGEEKKETTNK